MVIWIIGMYGAGKTTLGTALHQSLKAEQKNVVFINGGDIRAIMGNDLGHTVEERLVNAGRISRLCKYISDEGIHVICAVQSLFHSTQQWNRQNIPDYFEVFLDASFDTLLRRDHKNLYRQALRGLQNNVVGVDIEFVRPLHPDLVIDNNLDRDDVTPLVDLVRSRVSFS